MTNYLIIDSNIAYAEKLHEALRGSSANDEQSIVLVSDGDLAVLSDNVAELIDKRIERGEPDTIVLINAEVGLVNEETILPDGCLQQQQLVELAFWLRCKHKLKNAIVFYSLQSVSRLLKAMPENFILASPGCYHLRLQTNKEQIVGLSKFKPLESLDAIKPYLKPRINLTKRHQYANYAGMALMMLVARGVWEGRAHDELLKNENPLHRELARFLTSLDYHLLSTYFDLGIDELKPRIAFLRRKPAKGSILLIDDLAAGWEPVISQMLYGDEANKNIASLTIHFKGTGAGKSLDLPRTREELEAYLKSNNPHLILLDLRLCDEEGKRELKDLGGYQILRFIKQVDDYKGVPVIVFTASSNAEATKKLIEKGADAVWTKPGLDEYLTSEQVIERYEMLLHYVDNVFTRFAEPIKLESNQDIEDSRSKVMQKTEFLKYRARLSNLKTSPHYFNEFTDIFIDTNILLESEESLCNVFKLAQICGKTRHVLSVEGMDFEVPPVPKVVLVNFVLDEIIHLSKEENPDKRYFWKSGLVAYDVARGLFQDSLARTEFNSFQERSLKPECALRRTREDAYADPRLINDIIRVVSGRSFQLWRRIFKDGTARWESKDSNYKTPNTNVLLITNEAKNVAGKIPQDLTNELRRLNILNETVHIISLAEFTREIEAIQL
jgi:CheY-like chemotaxis protein